MSDGIATLLIEPDARQLPGSSVSAAGPSGAVREFLLGPENDLVSMGIGLEADSVDPHSAGSQSLRLEVVPLTIHATSGLGKSELLRAIASTWSRQHSTDSVLLTTADDFARAYADAANLDDIPRFQQRYKRMGLLLIDDLQLLRRKAGAQEQLASVIGHRQRHGRPTVFTARKPLRLIHLSDRLTSRISSGLVIPLRLPSATTRELILKTMCHQRQIQLSLDAERLLIDQESFTVPQITGLLNQMRQERLNHVVHLIDTEASALAGSAGDPNNVPTILDVDVDQVRRLLKKTNNNVLTPQEIIRVTARYFGLPPRNLTGTSRRKMDVLARSLAMFMIRDFAGISFQKIGDHFGGRDHTTVMHAQRKVLTNQETDATMRGALQEIRRRLREKSGSK